MTEVIERSRWTTDAFGFPKWKNRLIEPEDVIGVVAHYPATSGSLPENPTLEQTLARVQGYHRYHTQTRGWADIGYPVLIDQAGRRIVGAGDTHAAAHSATDAVPDANERLMAICFILGNDDRPTPAAIAAANEQIAEWKKKFPNLKYVLGHQEVPGASTACPGRVLEVIGRFDLQRPGPYAASPVVGRVTGHYGWRTHPKAGTRNFHNGMDLAPPKPGQTGVDFVAMFGGVVREVMNGYRTENPITGKNNTGSFILIDGPGGGSEWYGHHRRAYVKPGETVEAGQPLGEIGKVGDTTGEHLHFETWGGRTQDTAQDPRLAFSRYGLTPGKAGESKQRVLFGLTTGSRPAKKPSKAKAKSGRVPHTDWTVTVDGDFGSFTIRSLQKLLRDLGYKAHTIDGRFGPFTIRSLQQWLADQGQTGHAVDGVFGRHTVRSLQQWLRGKGYTGHAVDGDFGTYTIRSLQQALIDGKIR